MLTCFRIGVLNNSKSRKMEDRYFEAFIDRLDACFKSRSFGLGGLNRGCGSYC